ncbi:uncharacterized protein PV06_08568 [Exophiala oligosperma]|uniref:Cell wall biogenesis protein Mhp1 n=1 Tax=Exophiala oligosperma TaxID=215243 RepID=A0A0D2AIU4_9EURO|nr:uncharacterized protein PV06_08568 [Exophiala oligosperma]KIW40011.1 hypothetical protein PV06_08568 [Exophiala oligosperma]
MASTVGHNLDVDWLLHSKKELSQSLGDKNNKKDEVRSQSPPQIKSTEPTPPSTPTDHKQPKKAQRDADSVAAPQKPVSTPNGTTGTAQANATKAGGAQTQPKSQPQNARPTLPKGQSAEDKKNLKTNTPNGKRDGRRSSWISSISSKFSSSTSPTPSRQSSMDDRQGLHKPDVPSPQPSPKVELSNPFNKKESVKDGHSDTAKEEKPTPVVHAGPRRPSVLVAAGKETKLEHPGFLSSALRRLSSSSNATMGKGGGASGAICPRRVMNIDQNRQRIKINEFDQAKLKRVAFCVDVEIAGFSASADEEPDKFSRPTTSNMQKQSLTTEKESTNKKDVKDAKVKDIGEGAALKNPAAATEAKEEKPAVKPEPTPEESKDKQDVKVSLSEATTTSPENQPPPTTTRKKEKKKRSEAERKERKEKKRRHAEANGLVPLELTRDDDDSDSNSSNTPPGASTPRRPMDGPTIDPLRIYKRCCQLRETSILPQMKEQITKPSATLAEAPGTVAVMDLTGFQMSLQDINTLGDWLAIVPVRKLILENCGLTDEGVRVILSGLSSCKSIEQARQNRKLPKRYTGKRGMEQMGVIEKLSLKDNPAITNLGWKHIGLFLHMSTSLKAIDLSGLQFPKSGDLSRTPSGNSSVSNADTNSKMVDLGTLIIHALTVRLGDKLEELILGRCGLSTKNIQDIVECAMKCKIRRLGLADNNVTEEALAHLVRYVKSGSCEGLDLGGNDLRGIAHTLAEVATDTCPLFAISLSACNLTPTDLSAILIPFGKLTNLKFMDLSQNKALFSGGPNAVPVLRKFLPRLTELRRIHLSDVDLTPDQVVALSEILPDCPNMMHISILDNAPLLHAMNSKEEGAQEEACAFFAALMTAVRVSETICAVEIEVPGADSSEVVKALASQVVAYSLRNMERTTLDDMGIHAANTNDKDAPEVLLHLVGHMDGYSDNHDNDEPAPDEDYLIASTGIVKALDVCLTSKDGTSRAHSRNISPSVSGTATPRQGATHGVKPRDVSLQLCDSARKIRMRLRPVLIREDRAGNDYNYRRLFNLDQTLQRMIERFEDEYPETKATDPGLVSASGSPSPGPSTADPSMLSASVDSDGLTKMTSADEYFPTQNDEQDSSRPIKLSRTTSETSLAAKAFTDEEGRMHRLGQSIRREVLKPTGMEDNLHGTSNGDHPEPPHIAALRAKLEALSGEDIRAKVQRDGADEVLREIGLNAEELLALRDTDPEGFETFRKSQMAAAINSGLVDV